MAGDAPLPVRPRLVAKPWGGSRLAWLGSAPAEGGDPLGEAHLAHGEAVVALAAGAGEDATLDALAAADPAAWAGARGLAATAGRPIFPLLVKLIDAAADLSIQLHPDDATAQAAGDPVGKTEVWHVLAAEPGAVLYLGLAEEADPAAFIAALRAGSAEAGALLRRVPAEPGTTILLPAGTIHAIGAGVLVYELQQPNDTTYRLSDWGRRDRAGRGRDLHLDAGLRAMNPDLRPSPIPPVALPTAAGRRDLLVATRWFALERIVLHVGDVVPVAAEDSPQALTGLGGVLRVGTAGGTVDLQTGDTAAVAAGVPLRLTAIAPGVLLRAWVPDLARDVVRPARAAGTDDATIAALAGPLPDLRALL